MRDRLNLALHVATACLVLCGFASLTSIRGYPTFILLLPILTLLFMPIGERLDHRFPGYRIISNAITIAFGCFLPLMFLSLGLLYSVIGLIFFITCFLLIHRKTERNYYYIFLMSFFLLLAASVQSPEPVIGLVLAAYIVSAVWCFVLVRLYFDLHGGRMPESLEGQSFASRSMAMDLGPLRGKGQTHRGQFDALLGIGLFLLGFSAIGLTALIFVFTPRIEAGILGRSDIPISQTGLSDSVDLTGGTYIQQDLTVVMRVDFPDGTAGLPAPMYWRVTTLPNYFEARWSRRNIREHYHPDLPSLFPRHIETLLRANPHEVNRQGRPAYPIVRQLIFMDDVPEEGVPALDLVQRIALPSSPRNTRLTWDSGQDFTVNLHRSGPRQLEYEAFSEVSRPLLHELRADPADYSMMAERDFDLLTYQDLLPETIALVEDITSDAENLYDKAMAISDWLSGPDFLYTLNVPPLTPDHAIDHFILEVRMGHCELFASAMALMLRSLDIPSRVVLGYMGGEWNDSEDAFIVRASMAHLWVEVLFPEHGWIRFDPSPRGDDEIGGAFDNLARQLSIFVLRAKMFWFQEVVGFDSATQWDRLRNISLALFNDFSVINEETGNVEGYRIPYPILALVGVVGALLACAYIFGKRSRDTSRPILLSEDQNRAAKLYRALRKRLKKFGLKAESATAEEVQSHLDTLPIAGIEHARTILDTYNTVRFGMRPLDQSRYNELRKNLRELKPLPDATAR